MTTSSQPQTQLPAIDARALSWFVANQAGGDSKDCDAWRAADPRHDAAYVRIEQLWGSPALAKATKKARPARQRQIVAMTAAVTLCLFTSTTIGLRLTGNQIAWPADHSTSVGQIASTRLDDGTLVMLDSGSAIDVNLTDERREVRLLRGRAFIDVAKDERPFRLLSGDAVIRDIGTRFAVAREGGREHVAVQEGIVELRAAAADTKNVVLHAGMQSSAVDGSVMAPSPVKPFETFGWTRQRLYFSDRPLGEVVTELRRYYRGWIVVANNDAAAMRISGGLNLEHPDAAMAELARLSGMRITRVAGRILILR